ncbi:MAG: hypothetical protein MZV65_52460 [Chromatiales bacterium]|nr:hypothetical protein [Chromatiales bacterium]
MSPDHELHRRPGRGAAREHFRVTGDTEDGKFELDAEFRDAEGKGASRRLRRAGKVPAILYGGRQRPRAA